MDDDIAFGKYTAESISHAELPPELEQRLWTILCVDRKVGPRFHKLLVRSRIPEERLQYIRKVYPTRLTLCTWVRDVVKAVAQEDPDIAEEFADLLKGGRKHPGDTDRLDPQNSMGSQLPSSRPQSRPGMSSGNRASNVAQNSPLHLHGSSFQQVEPPTISPALLSHSPSHPEWTATSPTGLQPAG